MDPMACDHMDPDKVFHRGDRISPGISLLDRNDRTDQDTWAGVALMAAEPDYDIVRIHQIMRTAKSHDHERPRSRHREREKKRESVR